MRTRDEAMAQVVTYAEAYRRDMEADLCAACAAGTPEAARRRDAAGIGVLGAVQRGVHRGSCDACGAGL